MKHYLPAPIGFYVCDLEGFGADGKPALEKHPVIAWIISHGDTSWGAEKTCSVTLSGIYENANMPILCPTGEVVDAGSNYSSLADWIAYEHHEQTKDESGVAPWNRRRIKRLKDKIRHPIRNFN